MFHFPVFWQPHVLVSFFFSLRIYTLLGLRPMVESMYGIARFNKSRNIHLYVQRRQLLLGASHPSEELTTAFFCRYLWKNFKSCPSNRVSACSSSSWWGTSGVPLCLSPLTTRCSCAAAQRGCMPTQAASRRTRPQSASTAARAYMTPRPLRAAAACR